MKPAPWIQRLHIYCGLQASVALLLLGVAGLAATVSRGDPDARVVREIRPFAPMPGETRRALVNRAFAASEVPFGATPPGWSIKEDSEGRIRALVESITGSATLEIDTTAQVLRVLRTPQSLGEFALSLHKVSFPFPVTGRSPLVALWGLYMEFTIAALAFLALSSVYLWLTQRRSSRLAAAAFVLGVASATAVFTLVR